MVNKMLGVEKVRHKGVVSTLQPAEGQGCEQVVKVLRRVRKKKRVPLVWHRISQLC